MKTLLLLVLILVPVSFTHAAAYLKFDGVDGETKASADTAVQTSIAPTTATAPTRATGSTGASVQTTGATGAGTTGAVAPQPTNPEPVTPALLEIDGVKGETTKKGKVEMEWKVEEGEKGAPQPGTPRDVSPRPEETMPDFSILLGGGEGQTDEERMKGLERAQAVILEHAHASDQAIEQVSLNFEKITTKVRQEVKLFGFIPVEATAEVDIDTAQQVKVHFPWWAFLATGADSDALGDRVFQTISNVLKTKHDTVKNAISNVR